MTRGIGGPNRPPEKPFKILTDKEKAEKAAKAEAKALPAPEDAKGKKPLQLTPEENAALDRKIAKLEAKQMEAAKRASLATHEQEQANRAAGLGTSGVAHEEPTPSPTPKILSRNNSDVSSTSSFGSAYSAGSLPSHSSDSTLPSFAGGSPSSDRPMRDAKHLAGDPSSEPSTPGSSRLTRSMSEASSLNSQDIREFHEAMRKAGGRPVYDPLDTDVNVPDIGSGPSTPATKPHAGQDGRVTFPDSPSSNSLTSVDWELPDTQHAQPRPPEKKRPLGKFTIPQRIGMAVAGAIGIGGFILAKVVGSDGDSSNDVKY